MNMNELSPMEKLSAFLADDPDLEDVLLASPEQLKQELLGGGIDPETAISSFRTVLRSVDKQSD